MGRSNHQQDEARVFHCHSSPLSGHKYVDIMPQTRRIFRSLQKQTKRRPYIRSSYFKKDKIFFDYFWIHLNQKHAHERARRLKYFPCALELLRVSRLPPTTFVNIDIPGAIHHRFIGSAPDKSQFAVIIKQDCSSGRKFLLSLFPLAK